MMAQHLFVYGTLMSGAGHRMGARLQREARLVGPARIKGRLYDLGAYPALVETGPADGDVHGEVFELIDPSRSLPLAGCLRRHRTRPRGAQRVCPRRAYGEARGWPGADGLGVHLQSASARQASH